ncbi:unnamed protein product [Rotaria socialis]|uniref:RanBP2-type domain-containing protein n=3 Tax=Rotaria socialis TaxID=392032 RepID=A0A821B009_9BILA|nr:unnamed protein product [Rotaria socialis]CAF4588378.1 unnamed protein product [Rotaria socialis]
MNRSGQQCANSNSSSTEGQDWKCRQCGYTNNDSNKSCETCNARKPMRPRIETRPSYVERSPSSSSSNHRTPSPEDESIPNRPDPRSSVRDRRRSSSGEHVTEKDSFSDSEKPYYNSSTQLRSHRKSQNPDAPNEKKKTTQPHEGKYSASMLHTIKYFLIILASFHEQSSTRGSSSSVRDDSKLFEDDYEHKPKKSTAKKSSSGNQNYDDELSSSKMHSSLSSSPTPPPDYSSCIASQKQQSTLLRYDSEGEQSSLQSVGLSSSKNKSSSHDVNNPSNLKQGSSRDDERDEPLLTKTSDRHVPSKGSSKHIASGSSLSVDDKKGSRVSAYDDDPYQSSATAAKPMKPPTSPSSSKKSNKSEPIIVYIPDLPVNIDSNQLLESMIRQCLELKHKQKIVDVKCDAKLGIGIVYLHTDEDKHNLTNIIEKIIIETSKNTMVSFVDELELVSYIVVDNMDTKDLPSVDDICRRWVHLYKVQSEPQCERLSAQFPNIYRIITHSLDELLPAMSTKEFSINKQFATVYFRADCAFFEDLPRTTTLDRLTDGISSQISDKYMSKELIHIQYNKANGNAIVLTSGRARIWALHSSILLDGRSFMKKDSLACRLLIRTVPKGVSTSLIRNHKMFGDAVVKIFPSDEHVVLELSDRSIYEKCIDQGVVRVDQHLLGIEVYTFTSNPENSEIDAENWYETEMVDHKPDIMPFISNPQHPIFQFKWNPRVFLEQLRLWTSNERKTNEKDQVKFEKLCNLKRHLLRMTVMLNTIGVVKRGFYRIGDKEIKLKPDRLKTILYDHKSKLQRGKTMSLSHATEFPYKSTSVSVVNEDCLIVYKNLVNKGCRPVVLNMANATSPGGGYKRGDGAQEETLFRRSNYFQSLDLELDDGKPTARFYCNSNCDLEPLGKGDRMYEMDEFGAIYTAGLTVFRQPEDTGYTFMDIPMYDVCAIAMAAYRDPKIENDLLTSKYSLGMRKKIENIFAIAYHQKHDSLVLSALGCGAFRNPPKHVAAIFKSVIEQYAGYFKYIYFAIVDDHNAGQDLNPTGNYRPFHKLLDNLEEEPKRQYLVDMMIGPWRILDQKTSKEITLSDIRIRYLDPCFHGGKCNDLNTEQHCREFSHPPLCPYTNDTAPCKKKNDTQHMLWFRHREKCSYGGECELIETDFMHSNEFEHPEFCRDGGRCENMGAEHLKAYQHLPLCKYRRECVSFNSGSVEHCQSYRHCVPMCRFGHFCTKFHDEKHLSEENHPFLQPCSFTPFHCRQYNSFGEAKDTKTLGIDVQNHCFHYSHVCRYGRQCRDKSDIHWKTTIHIARNICSFGDKCAKTYDEDHLNSFSHPGIADIRLLCSYPTYKCRDRRKPEHIIEYRHHGGYDNSGVIGCFGQNHKIDFVKNQERIIQTINTYVKDTHSKQLSVSLEVQKWVKGLQPIHRCSKLIFESILVHGHVMSRDHMENLKRSYFAAQAVQEHKRVRGIFDRYKMAPIEDNAKEYIKAIVSLEYGKKYAAGDTTASGGSDDNDDVIRRKERILHTLIKPDELNIIKQCAIDIAEASWNLHKAPTGIKYETDKALGTDKHVFSILGPHLGHYYGDIILVFKSEVMLHPDANFSPQAGTSFASGSTFKHRPWVKDPGTEPERIKCFHESKLHCAVPGYEYAAAAELIVISGLLRNTINVDVRDIITHWKKVDSHQVLEAHLPQLVPLDYIEEVYIAKNLFDSLTPAAQESAKKIFRDSLHITKHEINLTDTGGGGSQPSDKSRADYQDYVMSALIEKFNKRKDRTRHLHGSVLTLAPSAFTDHIMLPPTIGQARTQYLRTHKQSSNSDDIYIYWETMYGDMMVTLSDERIDPDKTQPDIQCLVCYIAERPSTITATYSETYSYLNAGEPYRHSVIKITGKCSSSSRTFHRGANIENFLTYCLKIEKKTGQATLSHAGPNSIYCYETITCRFSKTTLDLSKLDYVHVSAGSQKVPIRNLTINFEKIPDLHPLFDRNFKRGDDPFHNRKSPHLRSRSPSPNIAQSTRDMPPSFIRKAANAVAGLFGYDADDKSLGPCPYSINCLFQGESQHMKKYSHPCPYSELCTNKEKEPNLTHEPHRAKQCPSKSSCQKLHDPVHRAQYRHPGYPDFLIPCQDGSSCHNKTSDHRIKYSHGEQGEVVRDKIRRTVCQFGTECRNQDDNDHCSKYSHPGENRVKHARSSSPERIACRHGSDCRDKNDRQHRSKFSHPDERESSPSSNSARITCRHGSDCRDKNDRQHCSKFSHPDEDRNQGHRGSNQDKTPCRHGNKCFDKDPHHRSKYSHPNKK